ncbi:outer membrane lipoprotein LolB [Azoarcus indigens]|uniref:Outer-membrane lipoprotein LolB n=1 Tax=Azoarcus indigens TaxID=29545 RepID=A0A4R6E6Y9_9RHOO|nr:lipoprotein insertase outer membrane protein LolB [Azoarcus indigens]NMG64033.1 outer membrane lipoprotein LolB [Azoarcus indigens]TDN53690.1 outer membrane lipoprotein LolB [Azoarcus indigens]
MRRPHRLLLAATAASLLLGACAPLSPQIRHSGAAQQRQQAAAFELEGRLSASDGERAASGRMEWLHSPTRDSWTLLNPLGQIAAQLEQDASGAELVTADGRRYRAGSADSLLPQLLGVEVPVARLAQWVQAAPRREAEIRETDGSGRPTLLIDAGWRIAYLEYADNGINAAPRLMDISRGDTRLRLFIDRWTPTP